jgi:hypothetical protein
VWGIISIHTYQVVRKQVPYCAADSFVLVLAAYCEVRLRCFYPPTHAHLYYLLTCVADDVVLLAFREVLVDHGRLFAGVLALITVYNTSACVYLCAHALRSYAALYMRLLHDIPWPCPLAGDLWGMVDLYIHQMERGDDTAILIGHRSGAVECMW